MCEIIIFIIRMLPRSCQETNAMCNCWFNQLHCRLAMLGCFVSFSITDTNIVSQLIGSVVDSNDHSSFKQGHKICLGEHVNGSCMADLEWQHYQ